MSVLVTGAAGFIGFHTCRALSKLGYDVVGLDTLWGQHQIGLKRFRAEHLKNVKGVRFIEADIADADALGAALSGLEFTKIIHLAAQAGIRLSITEPNLYVRANLIGHSNMLELARKREVEQMLYASSSSVYGDDNAGPFAETDNTDSPVSFYAATKKACEASSYAYAKLYGLPQIGFRFFTVYGPYGRPDMAYWIFLKKILAGETIDVYNFGEMKRDFTYIDDIVTGILTCFERPPAILNTGVPHRIYNLGRGNPEPLMALIGNLEKAAGREAVKNMMPMQKGDVHHTWADISRAKTELDYAPTVSLADGITKFVDWYKAADTDTINS